MNESIKAFMVVGSISGIGFAGLWLLARNIINMREFSRWAFVWIGVSACAFLLPDFWMFCGATTLLLFALNPRDNDLKLAVALIAIMALPHYLRRDIPGFGPINFLFTLDYGRMIILLLLFPIFIRALTGSRARGMAPLFSVPTDKWILMFVILNAILTARGTTATDTLRSFFNNFVDIFVLYYAISRAIVSIQAHRLALFAMVCAVSVLAALTLYELATSWHLYPSLRWTLNTVAANTADYKWRGGFLRAGAAHAPIPVGMAMVFGIGALAYLRPLFRSSGLANMLGLLLLIALVATFSRGPMAGLIALVFFLALFGKDRLKRIAAGALVLVTLTILANVPNPAQPYLKFLPVIGESDEEANWTVNYRWRLIEASIKTASYNPLFGTPNFEDNSFMEEMRQGEGIIDITNSYLQVLLAKGYVGLGLFLAIFGSCLMGLARVALRAPPNSEYRALGGVLAAILLAHLVQLGTVSMLELVDRLSWIVVGFCGSYIAVGNAIHAAQQHTPHYQQPMPRREFTPG